jgi:hypothetical protein
VQLFAVGKKTWTFVGWGRQWGELNLVCEAPHVSPSGGDGVGTRKCSGHPPASSRMTLRRFLADKAMFRTDEPGQRGRDDEPEHEKECAHDERCEYGEAEHEAIPSEGQISLNSHVPAGIPAASNLKLSRHVRAR